MTRANRTERAKLIVGMLSKDPEIFIRAKKILTRVYGRIDFESDVMDFHHTEYYAAEMGKGLKRIFYGFKKNIPLNKIFKVKEMTNLLEKRFSRKGKRSINIDPGYINLSKLVLFTTKDYTHRIHLGNGIFGEVTLHYKNNSFNTWPWTYPDYRTDEYVGIFNSLRTAYKNSMAKA